MRKLAVFLFCVLPMGFTSGCGSNYDWSTDPEEGLKAVNLDSIEELYHIRITAGDTVLSGFSIFPAKDKFTEKFAKIIADKTGGRLAEIQCATDYPKEPADYSKIEKMAFQERDTNARPAIKNEIAGNTIIPFNTHEGSRDGGTYKTIAELEPDAKILKGLAIRGFDMEKDQSAVIGEWLKNLGFKER